MMSGTTDPSARATASDPGGPQSLDASQAESAGLRKPRLVAIDDEVEFTKALEQFFSLRGYEVKIALTGTSGLALVDSADPDVVLVDLKLPGMDGDQLLQRIRQSHPRAKVIVVTAYNDGGKTRDRLLSLGAFAHFDKPLTSLRDLAAMIRRAVSPAP